MGLVFIWLKQHKWKMVSFFSGTGTVFPFGLFFVQLAWNLQARGSFLLQGRTGRTKHLSQRSGFVPWNSEYRRFAAETAVLCSCGIGWAACALRSGAPFQERRPKLTSSAQPSALLRSLYCGTAEKLLRIRLFALFFFFPPLPSRFFSWTRAFYRSYIWKCSCSSFEKAGWIL